MSPANKDRAEHRNAFVSKCAAYLQSGVGLLIVDVVTDRRGNLHDELMARLGAQECLPMDESLYAVAYRPVERAGGPELNLWQERLAVGQPLPEMPLCLRGNMQLPADLPGTYERTFRELRIPLTPSAL